MQIIILFLLTVVSTLFGQTKLDEHFNTFKGTMAIYDQQADAYTIINEERAARRYSPFSTFKIPSSIIALETGTVSDVNKTLEWDKQKYPKEDWWPATWAGEHNLKSAIKYSVVPLYRHVASQIGTKKMKAHIVAFDYGNKDISSGIDNFWLGGSIKISGLEQVKFLKKFYNGQLKASSKTIDSVKSILIQESTENYTLSYKTGAGYPGKDRKYALGWLVGYVEKQDNVYFFALNIDGPSFSEILKPRIEIAKSILKEIGITQ